MAFRKANHRRWGHRNSRLSRQHRLAAELLEDRRLLAASELGSLFPGYRPDYRPDAPSAAYSQLHVASDDHHVGHDHGSEALGALPERTKNHVIGGVTHQFTWEPEAAVEAGASIPGGAEIIAAALQPLTSIPALNSNLAAAVSLYLDFNGHFEATWGAYSNATTPVYDVDGDLTTFSDQELTNIQDIWARVAEDYSPFNVNVTTVEPSVLASGAPANAANGVALRVAMGGSYADWYGSAAGGVGYINSFTSTIANTVYVFTAGGGIGDPRWAASTASHEAGHGFGLQHQSVYDASGTKTAEYNPGANGWHPIMGSGSSTWSQDPVNTWYNGPNSLGATTFQDDIAELARAANGFGYRADDHANTIAGATALTGSDTNWTGTGRVGVNSDIDWFTFEMAEATSLLISVSGPEKGQNLDAAFELRDAAGALVATANPGDSFDAQLIRSLAGRHYIGVQSSGTYGWIGQYTVSVTESLPGVTVSQSTKPFTTSESGRSESVTIVLRSKPTADVTFPVASSDESEGMPSTSAVVFTPDNWFTPQTVTITGVGDAVSDGAKTYAVTFAPAISGDPDYAGFDPEDLSLVNLDAAPGQVYWIRSNITQGLSVIQRSSLAGDGVETVLDIPAALGPPPGSFWNPSRLTIDPVGGKFYWNDATIPSIYRANLDGTGAEVVLTKANIVNGLTVDPVGRKLYWTDATLDKIQRSNLDGSNVEDVITAGLNSPGGLEIDATAGKIYWTDSGNFTISRANLDGSDVEIVAPGVENIRPSFVVLDPAAGKMYFNLRENFQLNKIYRANLDGSQRELLIDLNAFDPSVPNPVVQAMSLDHVGKRIHWTDSLGQKLFSADFDGSNVAMIIEGGTSFRGLAVAPASPGVTIAPRSGLTTTESGGMATFTVVLNTPPTAEVTIPLATSDASEGTVAIPSLTFTPTNWSIPQIVTVTGANDGFGDGDQAYVIALGPAQSGDAAYDGLDPADAPIVNLDDEQLTTTVTKIANAAIPDRGLHTSTVDLDAPGLLLDLDVRVNIVHGWNEDLDVTLIAPDGTRIELFTDVGGSSANFTNTVLDDEATASITAGVAPFTGRFKPEGNLTVLEGKIAAGTWKLEVRDDARWIAGTLLDWSITARTISGPAAPAAIVTPTTGLATTEDGGAASFTVVLDAQPSSDVTIPVSSSDATEGAVSTSALTFTSANWNVPQTVTITGVDDSEVDGNVAYMIVLGAASSLDLDFNGLDPADASISNLDNDVPPTRFYVVDDGSANRTFEYGASGAAVESYAMNAGNAAPRGAASTAAGDRVWVVDANRKVYIYDVSGGLLGSWSAGTLASNATPEGIATNGTDVWIVDSRSDKVFKYAGAASRLSGTQNAASSFNLNSSNTNPKDIVTDGASLWVVNDASTDKVFKYTAAGGLLGSWTIASANSSPTGITIDPTNVSDIWIVDSGTDRVYQYTGAASRTSGSQTAAASFALAAGNGNPQGIADPPPELASALPAVAGRGRAGDIAGMVERESRWLAQWGHASAPKGNDKMLARERAFESFAPQPNSVLAWQEPQRTAATSKPGLSSLRMDADDGPAAIDFALEAVFADVIS